MEIKTLSRLQHEGLEALIQSLGPIDAIRFLQIYDPGYGDYTAERKTWLPDDPDIYFQSIQRRKEMSQE
jgi:hypothetical protein